MWLLIGLSLLCGFAILMALGLSSPEESGCHERAVWIKNLILGSEKKL